MGWETFEISIPIVILLIDFDSLILSFDSKVVW